MPKTFIYKIDFVDVLYIRDYTYPYEQYHTSVATEELVSL